MPAAHRVDADTDRLCCFFQRHLVHGTQDFRHGGCHLRAIRALLRDHAVIDSARMSRSPAALLFALLALVGCASSDPGGSATGSKTSRAPDLRAVGRIAQIGLIDCFAASTVDAKGRTLSCEPSAVEIVRGRALVISDKETADELPSPIMWLALKQPWPEVVSSTSIRHDSTATIRGTRKIEGLTTSAEGDLMFATSDFDWPPDENSAEPDLYNRLLYWPVGHEDRTAIANPTRNGDVVSSVSLRPYFSAALKSDAYPSGPPYFKIEGLTAMPRRELWFGVREVGPDFEHPDYTITILKASYSKADDGTVALRPPFNVVTRVDPSVRLPSVDRLGLSSLARDDGVLAMLTSREAPEGEVGHQSYIWLARLSARAEPDFHVVAGADGRSLKLPCKAEGVDFVSPSRLLVVCDEDRSPSTFAGSRGDRFTRRPNQGVFMIVDLSGLR